MILEGEVRAAGGVVWRRRDGVLEVVVVHRPAYDDWSLPKGKAEGDEDDEACALREVEEETGLVCDLGAELPTVTYLDRHRRPKRVRYWAMQPVSGALAASNEVDRARWMPVADAGRQLTYERDHRVLAAFSAGAG